MITTVYDVGKFVYNSYVCAREYNKDKIKDEERRNPKFTGELLKLMGSPDVRGRNILVTGSKGKGSLSIILNGILQAMGYNVGLFTGPHLMSFNERIVVNGKMISDEAFVRLARQVEPKAEEIQKRLKRYEYIGPVGILAVIAAMYFNENKTDFNIIECGKGARFDDVAQMRAEISLINSMFLEHTEELGPTISKIAYHKAGVIQPGQRGTFLGMQPHESAYEFISNEAKTHNVPLFSYGAEFEAEDVEVDIKKTNFVYKGHRLNVSLCGEHQAYNAATAIAAAEFLLQRSIDKKILKQALSNIKWPGRLDIVREKPLIILDGCINRLSARYVVKYLECIGKRPDFIVMSIPDDKDAQGVIDVLKPYVKRIILTIANNPTLKYSNNVQYLYAKKALGESNVQFIENSEQAINYAASEAKEMVCVLGTISLIRDAMVLLT